MASNSRERRRKARWNRRRGLPPRLTSRGFMVSIAVAALFFAFAAYISLIAPVHVLNLHRDGPRAVRATSTQQLWLFVPFHTRVLRDVDSLAIRTHREPTYLAPGSDSQSIQPEEEGTLVLRGERGTLEISTSPYNLYEHERRIRNFLSGSDAHLRLWLVSNWKIAVIVEGVILIPALLILPALAWDVGKAARRLI